MSKKVKMKKTELDRRRQLRVKMEMPWGS